MAIYYDDFQSYALGNNGPWGSLNRNAGSITATISNTARSDGTAGPYGKSKYLTCGLGGGYFNDAIYRASGSVFAAVRRGGILNTSGRIIEFWNGTSVGANAGNRIFWIEFNADGTLSPYCITTTPIGPPSTFVFSQDEWCFVQVNASFSTSGGGFLVVAYNVAVDGNSVMSGTFTSAVPVANLVHPAGFWDETIIQAGGITIDFGEFTIDTLQSIPTFPNAGTPVARSTNQVIELLLVPGSVPLLVSCPSGTGFVGIPYDSFSTGSGGTLPYTWAITSGSLPPGLSLNTLTGEVSGTPTTNGTYAYTIKLTDANGNTATSNCQIVITTASIPSLTCPIGTGTVGTAYDGQIGVIGGTAPFTYAIVGGSLPPGLSLNTSTGEITGTPTTSGLYLFTIQVTDANGVIVTDNCQIIISSIFPPPVPIDTNTCKERTPPILYGWEPSYLERPEDIAMRASDYEDGGLVGAKFLQGFTLQADTEGQNKLLTIEGDAGAVLQTYTINHNGEQIKPYVFNPAQIASLMRFISPDDVPWRFFGIRYIWEPLPELVTYYETQGTTHDLPGYQFLKDGYIALISSATVTLTINVDGTDFVYTIPSTGGVYKKNYLIFGINGTTGQTLKGKLYTYKLSSSAGFRLFQKDCEVRVHGWSGGDYVVRQPFGDTSRVYGARI